MPNNTQPQFMPALHALRGAAALWVVLFHAWHFSGASDGPLSGLMKLGWLGVHLFYALSAFLLGRIYLQQRQSGHWRVGVFFKKRALRIFPAYHLQLLVILLLAALGVHYRWPSTSDLLAHVAMFFNLPPTHTQPLNGVWWTLPVEFAFYLLLPALMWLMQRHGVWLLLLLGCAVTWLYRGAFWSATQPPNAILVGQLPGVFIVFVLGLIAAQLTLHEHWTRCGYKTALAALGAGALWGRVLLHTDNYWSGSLLMVFWESLNAAIIVVLIVALHRMQHVWLNNRLTQMLGDLSYGIYLWHLPVMLLLKDRIQHTGALFCATLGGTLVLAWLSYHGLEKRCMRGTKKGAQRAP